MTHSCPLCRSNNIINLESLSVKKLNIIYLKSFNIENALKSDYLNYLKCQSCGLGFFDPMETGDEYFYEKLQIHDWYYMDDKEEFNIAQKFVSAGNILEVGSGKAAFAEYIDKEKYTGLEFNDEAIKKASDKGINLLKESIEDHSTKGYSYETIVSFQVLEHVSSPRSFIQGCVDCLIPGGKLIIGVPSQDGLSGLESNNILDLPPHHVTHWSEETLRKVADLFDLKCIAIQHEPIAIHHSSWAKSAALTYYLKNKLGVKRQLLETRKRVQLVNKVSNLLSKWLPIDLSKLKGHSVVAVYKK